MQNQKLLDRVDLKIYITIDLAISEKLKADYSVVMATGISSQNELWVLEYKRKRMLPNEVVTTIFDFVDRYNPKAVGVETVHYQKAMLYSLRDEMRRQGRFFIVQELKADADKSRRIAGLQPYHRNGAIYLRRGMQELEDEMLMFGGARLEHDDLLDALAYVLQMMKPMRRPYVPGKQDKEEWVLDPAIGR